MSDLSPKTGKCTVCARKYSIRADGNLAMHTGSDRRTECPGSRHEPENEEDQKGPEEMLVFSEVEARYGVPARKLLRWFRAGHISAKTNASSVYTISREEIDVAILMNRLLTANINDVEMAAGLARRHLHDVAVLAEIGYTGDSITTEHTIGDGLVLSIT